MTTSLFKADTFEIVNLNKSHFIINFEYRNPKLINSLIKTKLISGASCDEIYKMVKFKADNIKSLQQFLDSSYEKHGKRGLIVPDIAKMVRSLSRQLHYLLEKENVSPVGYNPNDIIVINDEKFLFLGTEWMENIDEDDKIIISSPFHSKDFFISPELLNIKSIPSYIHYKTSYFSLACLVIYAITTEYEFYEDYLREKEPKQILEVLNNHPIQDTRLYFLLSRCLLKEPKERSIIYI